MICHWGTFSIVSNNFLFNFGMKWSKKALDIFRCDITSLLMYLEHEQ